MEQSRIELDGGSRPIIRPHEKPKDRRNSPANQKMTAHIRALLQVGFRKVCMTDYYGEFTLTFTVADGTIQVAEDRTTQTHQL